MQKTLWEKKWDVISRIAKRIAPGMELDYYDFWHYTSLPVLFKILDGNEFWASNVRFSNDAMEERMLKLDNMESRDDYIVCVCAEDDMLSQWRGYCHSGGVAIKLYFNYPQDYSILHSDFDTSGKYEVYENTPLPVVYLSPDAQTQNQRKQIKDVVDNSGYAEDIRLEDILPYMKNGCFFEERESRMVFSNINGNLSKCIRFRTLQDGVKVPYIVIRHGVVGKMKGNCLTDPTRINDDYIKYKVDQNMPIWIEEGADQEAKYYEVIQHIKEYTKRAKLDTSVKLFCRGKLPVEEITVAPTYDRERKAEQIKRFCMSKYWLKNVKVKVSEIPYIQPAL